MASLPWTFFVADFTNGPVSTEFSLQFCENPAHHVQHVHHAHWLVVVVNNKYIVHFVEAEQRQHVPERVVGVGGHRLWSRRAIRSVAARRVHNAQVVGDCDVERAKVRKIGANRLDVGERHGAGELVRAIEHGADGRLFRNHLLKRREHFGVLEDGDELLRLDEIAIKVANRLLRDRQRVDGGRDELDDATRGNDIDETVVVGAVKDENVLRALFNEQLAGEFEREIGRHGDGGSQVVVSAAVRDKLERSERLEFGVGEKEVVKVDGARRGGLVRVEVMHDICNNVARREESDWLAVLVRVDDGHGRERVVDEKLKRGRGEVRFAHAVHDHVVVGEDGRRNSEFVKQFVPATRSMGEFSKKKKKGKRKNMEMQFAPTFWDCDVNTMQLNVDW